MHAFNELYFDFLVKVLLVLAVLGILIVIVVAFVNSIIQIIIIMVMVIILRHCHLVLFRFFEEDVDPCLILAQLDVSLIVCDVLHNVVK